MMDSKLSRYHIISRCVTDDSTRRNTDLPTSCSRIFLPTQHHHPITQHDRRQTLVFAVHLGITLNQLLVLKAIITIPDTMMMRLSRAALQRRQAIALLGGSNATRFCPAPTAVALYHGSPASSMLAQPPVRRSRGTSNGNDNKDEDSSDRLNENIQRGHNAVTNPDHFLIAAEALFDKLEVALQPMRRKNEVFVITRTRHNEQGSNGSSLAIDLKADFGSYKILVDMEHSRLIFQSPISGRLVYFLSAKTDEWLADPDGHSFVGMLVRDLNKQCQGLPEGL